MVASGEGGHERFAKSDILAVVQKARARDGFGPLDPFARNVTCHLLHPHEASCELAFLKFLRDGFFRSIRVYAPVYIVPLVLFRSGAILKHPLATALSTAIGISRSSLFLASYCGMCWVRLNHLPLAPHPKHDMCSDVFFSVICYHVLSTAVVLLGSQRYVEYTACAC